MSSLCNMIIQKDIFGAQRRPLYISSSNNLKIILTIVRYLNVNCFQFVHKVKSSMLFLLMFDLMGS